MVDTQLGILLTGNLFNTILVGEVRARQAGAGSRQTWPCRGSCHGARAFQRHLILRVPMEDQRSLKGKGNYTQAATSYAYFVFP